MLPGDLGLWSRDNQNLHLSQKHQLRDERIEILSGNHNSSSNNNSDDRKLSAEMSKRSLLEVRWKSNQHRHMSAQPDGGDRSSQLHPQSRRIII
jgi:hypothetical protein